jgi:hypothetical protein
MLTEEKRLWAYRHWVQASKLFPAQDSRFLVLHFERHRSRLVRYRRPRVAPMSSSRATPRTPPADTDDAAMAADAKKSANLFVINIRGL